MTIEEKGSGAAYSEELNEIIDSFGYKWNLDKRYVILYPGEKNDRNAQVEKIIDKIATSVVKSKDPRINQRVLKIYHRTLTSAKIPAIKEIIADVVLLGVFSILFWELELKFFDPIALLLTLTAMAVEFASLVYSIYILSISDEEYLKSRFGFKREGNTLKVDVYAIARKKENELIRNLFFSSVFILLAILPIFHVSLALEFVNRFLNFIAFFLVIFVLFIQFLRVRFVNKSLGDPKQKFIAFLLSVLFFFAYVLGVSSGQPTITKLFEYTIDIMVVYGMFLLIQEIRKTQNYRGWVKSNWK